MHYKWNVEDMQLMNEKCNIFIGGNKIYNIETELSREEKIEFLDRMNEGKISYILNLADKFQNDKDNLAKNRRGEISDISLKKWLEKNDNRGLIDTGKSSIGTGKSSIGTINLLNYTRYSGRHIQDINIISASDVYCDFVDSLFHRQLEICEKQEKRYFAEYKRYFAELDDYNILSRKVSDYMYKYNISFGKEIWQSGNRLFFKDRQTEDERDLTIDELKVLEAAFEKIKGTMDKIIKSLPEMDYYNEYNKEGNAKTEIEEEGIDLD